MSRRTRGLLGCATVLMTVLPLGCGVFPEKVSKDDERLKPLWAAIARVDRESLGFTPMTPDATIRLETKGWGDDYDAMLHIDGETSRTVAFRKTDSGYDWIGEQEIHEGPGTYTSADGTFQEWISVTYETGHISGVPLNTVSVSYRGDDPRLEGRFHLTLAEAEPILREWKHKRKR